MINVKQTHTLASSDLVILPFFEDAIQLSASAKKHFPKLKPLFDFIKKHKDFEGKHGQTTLFHTLDVTFPRVLLVGLGKTKNITHEDCRKVGGIVRGRCKALDISKATYVALENAEETYTTSFLEGFLLAGYKLNSIKKKSATKTRKELKTLTLVTAHKPTKTQKDQVKETIDLIESVFVTRDFVNTPANELNPDTYEKNVRKLMKGKKVTMRVVNELQLKKMQAGLILGVGQGSQHPPRFVILECKTNKKKAKTVVLLGKGITFDTGGINIKPTGHIETMKMDMGGSATMLGVAHMLANNPLDVNVIVILAIAENAIGSKATRPGDVHTSLSGQTVEIMNTDAEGRLAMADALTYVQNKYKPDAIVDAATLTGACLVALGHDISAVISNNESLVKQMNEASTKTGEKVWELPLDKDLQKAVKGDISDLKNYTSGVGAGTIMAACFLNSFIQDNTPWLHLDIAGTAWSTKNSEYKTRGATGAMVRTIWEFLKNFK